MPKKPIKPKPIAGRVGKFVRHEIEEAEHAIDNVLHHHPHKDEKKEQEKEMNNTIERQEQPPTGVNVTQSGSTAPEENILNQAEAKEQQAAADVKKVTAPTDPDWDYHFEVEQGQHKLTAKPESGLNYNYHVVCQFCHWEGRYITKQAAETAARQHLALKYPAGE